MKVTAFLLMLSFLSAAGCVSSLMSAVRGGDVERVKHLLASGASPNQSSIDHPAGTEYSFPLIEAATRGNTAIVRMLLVHGADADAMDHYGCTPLYSAIHNGGAKIAIVKLLLEHGADPTLQGKSVCDGSPLEEIKKNTYRQNPDIAEIRRLMTEAAGRARRERQAEEQPRAAVVNAAPAPIAEPVVAAKTSSVDEPSYKGPERPDDFAVIVGIEKYSELPAAEYAERDAAAVRLHLAALGVPERNMVSLIGSKAARSAFVKTFETWLPLNVNAESTVWVYFSGHGAPSPASGAAYLLPWDGDPQFLDDTAYPIERLYSKLNALKAKRVIVALDSCFSGAGGRSVLAKGVRPLVTKIDLNVTGDKTVALTASSSEQISGTIENEGHGLFTYHLLNGLNGAATDARGRVSLEGLYQYLVPKVRDDAHRQNREQIPQLLQESGKAGGILLR